MQQLEVGAVLEGKVTGITKFGAFVELEKGVDGLIHISHLSNKFVKQPSDVLEIGQMVHAKVIDLNLEQKRISLSLKDLEGPELETEESEEPDEEE